MSATKSKLRGVVFQAWQICALDNGMNQFRIPFRSQPESSIIYGPEVYEPTIIRGGEEVLGKPMLGVYDDSGEWGIASPYQPGERLFVKETFCPDYGMVTYRADAEFDTSVSRWRWIDRERMPPFFSGSRWHPPQNCRETDSRFGIEITSVRAGRRQEISEEDAEACGIRLAGAHSTYEPGDGLVPSEAFRATWDAQHAKRGNGWAENGFDWSFGFRLTD